MRPFLAALPPSAALLAALSLAAPALADQCPQDFGAGLIVTSDDGGTARLTRNAEGLLEEVVNFEDGGDFRTTSVAGIFVLFYAEIDGDGADVAETVERVTPPVPVDQLPAIATGLMWSGEFQMSYADGETDTLTITVSVGPELTRSYGVCDFAVLPVTMRERYSDETDYLSAYDYIPALGVALMRAMGDWGRAPDFTLVPLSIRAIE